MTSPSQPSGFAAYFAVQPTPSSSAPFIHGLTSPPRTDSPSDSKVDPGKVGSSGQQNHVISSQSAITATKKTLDVSTYFKRAWKLTHDPELHPKGSVGRSKSKEIRQSGQGVYLHLALLITLGLISF